jgi:hypothetical protein
MINQKLTNVQANEIQKSYLEGWKVSLQLYEQCRREKNATRKIKR